MVNHSHILAWKIPWTAAWQATVHRVARVGHNLVTKPPRTNEFPLGRELSVIEKGVNEP